MQSLAFRGKQLDIVRVDVGIWRGLKLRESVKQVLLALGEVPKVYRRGAHWVEVDFAISMNMYGEPFE